VEAPPHSAVGLGVYLVDRTAKLIYERSHDAEVTFPAFSVVRGSALDSISSSADCQRQLP